MKFQSNIYEDQLFRSEIDLSRERFHGACKRVKGLVAAEAIKLKQSKLCQRLSNELAFIKEENRRGLAYIEQLIKDARELRRSLDRRENIINSREDLVHGYLSLPPLKPWELDAMLLPRIC